LGLGASLLRGDTLAVPMAVLLVLPLVTVAVVLLLALPGAEPGALPGLISEALRRALREQPHLDATLGMAALLAPVAAVYWLGQRSARLQADRDGLRGEIPRWLGIGLFRQTAGRWRIPWSAIRRVRLIEPAPAPNPIQRLGGFRLVIETEHGQTWVSPFTWFDRRGGDHRLTLKEALRARRLDPDRLVWRAALLRLMRARGITVEREQAVARRPTRGFDLTTHRGLAVQLVALFTGGLYALAETFFLDRYRPLEPLPGWPFALVAGAATLAVLMLGRGAPVRERLVVGALTVAALVVAVRPAMLRLNALSATPRTLAYVASAPGRFTPPVDALPLIDLHGESLDAYWSRYPPGASHEFTLLRGAAGFYQLDTAPLYARTRRFYREQRAAAPGARASR
jgi:hypothetical protein